MPKPPRASMCASRHASDWDWDWDWGARIAGFFSRQSVRLDRHNLTA
jgi:hypothetical protein